MMDFKEKIRTIPDFPEPGILFRDITTLLSDAEALNEMIERFTGHYRDEKIDLVVGIESRGFIVGAPLAIRLGKGFVPIRKAGKLPGPTHGVDYELEYGKDRVEVHQDAIPEGSRVLLVDDLIATGGPIQGSAKLIKMVVRFDCSLDFDQFLLINSIKILQLYLIQFQQYSYYVV